jgi:hypothetical protein
MDTMKNFRLRPEEILPVAEGWGSCIASDRITVDGAKVGYCYREAPDDDVDSGWRFLAGDESEEYMDCATNLSVYDVNTIANYDPSIIPILPEPEPCAFERDHAGRLARIAD